MIRRNDTYSLVLPIFIQDHLALREFRLSFGTGMSHKCMPVLPGSHIFQGWDVTSSLCFTGKFLILNYGRDILSLLLHALFCQQDKVCKVFLSLNRIIISPFKFTDEYQTANQGGNGWGKCLVSIFNPSNPKSWVYQEFPQILPTV